MGLMDKNATFLSRSCLCISRAQNWHSDLLTRSLRATKIHSNEITFVETAKNLQKQLMPVVVIGQVLFDWKIKEAWLRQRNCAPTILCKRSFKVIQGRPC